MTMHQEADVFENWVTTSEGAALTGYTEEHVRRLCRGGDVDAKKMAGVWLVNKHSLREHQDTVRYGRPKEREREGAS